MSPEERARQAFEQVLLEHGFQLGLYRGAPFDEAFAAALAVVAEPTLPSVELELPPIPQEHRDYLAKIIEWEHESRRGDNIVIRGRLRPGVVAEPQEERMCTCGVVGCPGCDNPGASLRPGGHGVYRDILVKLAKREHDRVLLPHDIEDQLTAADAAVAARPPCPGIWTNVTPESGGTKIFKDGEYHSGQHCPGCPRGRAAGRDA